MEDRFSRTRMLLGDEAMEKLKGSRVAVFGIGGVGGYVVEALARSGVGTLDLIDNDEVQTDHRDHEYDGAEQGGSCRRKSTFHQSGGSGPYL